MEPTELDLWNLRAHQSGVRRIRRNAALVRFKSTAHCNGSETKKCERKHKGFYLETLNAHDDMVHCLRRFSFLGHHTSCSCSALEWGTHVILINKMNKSKHMYYVPLARYLESLSVFVSASVEGQYIQIHFWPGVRERWILAVWFVLLARHQHIKIRAQLLWKDRSFEQHDFSSLT